MASMRVKRQRGVSVSVNESQGACPCPVVLLARYGGGCKRVEVEAEEPHPQRDATRNKPPGRCLGESWADEGRQGGQSEAPD